MTENGTVNEPLNPRDDWMRRTAGEIEVLEIDTDTVPLQGDTPAFRQLIADLKARYPRQAELHLGEGP